VYVAVARPVGGRCRFLRADGRFGPARGCRRPVYLPARGTASWRLSPSRRLRPGAYRVWSRGVDAAGNIERKTRRRNFRPLVLRR
jgi:hypothetical protein